MKILITGATGYIGKRLIPILLNEGHHLICTVRDIARIEHLYAKDENIKNPEFFLKKLYELEILREDDSQEEIDFFKELFYELLSLFTKPFNQDVFDFSDPVFFNKITELGERYSKSTELRKMNGNRGSKHFIYINRTFFGLYNLMFDLKANEVKINNYKKL